MRDTIMKTLSHQRTGMVITFLLSEKWRMIFSMNDEHYWDTLFEKMEHAVQEHGGGLPSISLIARQADSPYRILISTLISLRTKDEVTLEASARLFSLADTPESMLLLPQERIEQAIYPAGFYRTKASNILKISRILLEKYAGSVPADQQQLLALPGVGIKTANLTLNLGFSIEAICVDTHVHRISNRMGWISTRTPEESERALQPVMPRRYWIPLNELLVTYGQRICTPVSPFCSRCPVRECCAQIGVDRFR
jgi:endonuclease III